MGVDYSKVDPKTRELIEKVQKNRPDVLSLEELKKATAKLDALLVYLQKQNRTAEKTSLDLADVLFDVKESLDEFSSQEAPEMPDFAKPVVKAVEDLKTVLAASIKAIEVSPKIAAPNVKVEAPKIDLSGVEKAVKEVSKVVEAAIKKIPKTEIPKTDFKPLVQKFDVMLEKLENIDTGVRMKAQTPNVMKVTNVDGTPVGGSTTTNYITKIDDTTTTDAVYIGKAALTGSAVATSSAVWQIKRIDTSTLAMDKKWADGNDSFDNIWDSRSSLTYN
jgi:hypothetical protein